MNGLKNDLVPSGYTDEIRERERAKNLVALKLMQGELSYEEQMAYLNELSARVELRLLGWELEKSLFN